MSELKWWQTAVFYQVYPRSFADADGDGIGDLRGLTDRLDYLQDLGVDALWLSPHYPSPQIDVGYDIADYCAVNPEYGTLANFKTLLAEMHRRGLRLILDFVPNHTSDQHAWFQESRSSRDNPKRNWYIWRAGKNGGPPNNWYSTFSGSGWELDPRTGEYYYHFFFKEQPDVNWRNPQLKQAMWDALRYWLDLGVDGYRLDAIATLFEDPDFTDHTSKHTLEEMFFSSMSAGGLVEGETFQKLYHEIFQYQVDLPDVLVWTKELRQVIDEYPERMLVGESDVLNYCGPDALHMVFNFPLMNEGPLTPARIRANQAERLATLPPGGWPCNTLGNHDSPRVMSRFGDGEHDEALARLSLALLLTLRGTPFLYNGEEIGMTNFWLTEMSQLRDSISLFVYRTLVDQLKLDPQAALKIAIPAGRDKNRTPMQWSNAANAGFSPAGVRTWLPVNPNYQQGVNVADQSADPGSMLNFYRRMLHLRKHTPALKSGEYFPVLPESEQVLGFLRTCQEPAQTCLVLLNFSATHQAVEVESGLQKARLLFSDNPQRAEFEDPAHVTLAPFEVYIGELVG